MSVYDLYFAFGKPGTYLLDHTKECCDQRLPRSYYEWVDDHPIYTVKSLAVNANDTIFMAWDDADDGSWGAYNRGLARDYPILYDFLQGEGLEKCRVAFGPDPGDFVAINPETGSGKYVHSALSEHRVLKTSRRVKHCSLGQDDAYVVVWADGGVTWACATGYPELSDILGDTRQGDVVFVALNPYRRNEFFIALADGIVHIRASALAEKHVLNVLRDYSNIQVKTSSVTHRKQSLASRLGFSSSRDETKEFTQFIMKEVAGGIISTAIAATFSCTVM
ncbi:hypothetical protein PENSTE_c004G00073 [Penicillium steckii]|uniref:Uncharacterized protein n=1 Tax=Penicillium steckii TaxID=303698 RepID=A0A1V6TNL6_9EURO|nr:hypothetical protein PENSTE_c004G00073 [Penicillium steckii]